MNVRRMDLVARYPDGSASETFAYDVVEREAIDAVAIVAYARAEEGELEVYLRTAARVPLILRDGFGVDEGNMWELPAGLIDAGESPRKPPRESSKRSWAFASEPRTSNELGGWVWPVPGFIAERHFYFCVDVTALRRGDADRGRVAARARRRDRARPARFGPRALPRRPAARRQDRARPPPIRGARMKRVAVLAKRTSYGTFVVEGGEPRVVGAPRRGRSDGAPDATVARGPPGDAARSARRARAARRRGGLLRRVAHADRRASTTSSSPSAATAPSSAPRTNSGASVPLLGVNSAPARPRSASSARQGREACSSLSPRRSRESCAASSCRACGSSSTIASSTIAS